MNTYFLFFLLFGIPYTIGQNEIDLGPFDAMVKIGELSDLYLPLTPQDEKASSHARNEVEERRKLFSKANFPLPALDPYYTSKVPPISINKQLSSIVQGDILVKEIKISGAQQLQLESLNLRINTLRTDIQFNIPLLVFDVKFMMKLTVAGILPIRPSGPLRIKLKSIRAVVAAQSVEKQQQNHTSYQLSALHAGFHADNVKIILAGPRYKQNVMEIFDALDPSSIEAVKQIISRYVATEAIREINGILGEIPTEQVNAYLLN